MTSLTRDALGKLLGFLGQLEQAKIAYSLDHVRDAIMVNTAIPGERWEVEFFEDGHVEIERFVSTGVMEDEGLLDTLISSQGEP